VLTSSILLEECQDPEAALTATVCDLVEMENSPKLVPLVLSLHSA